MEGTVFLTSAVADVMTKHFVEARLHCDTQSTLSEEQFATNLKVRDDIGDGTLAMPVFVVVDPNTGERLGRFELSGGPGAWEGLWLEFLGKMRAKAGR